MGKPSNCSCSGYVPPNATSGACCYFHPISGWLCEEWATESWCNDWRQSNYGDGLNCFGVSGFSDGNCASCFTAGSEVLMFDGAIKFIEDIEIGDRVVSIHGGHNTVLKPIRTTLGDRKLVSINCSKPFVTEDHPIMTEDGFKSFNYCQSLHKYPNVNMEGELYIGDKIRTTGVYEKLHKFDFVEGDNALPLHNLELDGDHTYFVESYGVHNKSCHDADPNCISGIVDPSLPGPGSGQYCGGFEITNPLSLDNIAFSYQFTWPNGTGTYDLNGAELFVAGTLNGNTVSSSQLLYAGGYSLTFNAIDGYTGAVNVDCFAQASGYCQEVVLIDDMLTVPSITGSFCLNVSGVPYPS